MTSCTICTKDANNAYVCIPCKDTALENLGHIADLAAGLDEKRARIGSTWSFGSAGRASETPLPYDPRVSKVAGPISRDLNLVVGATMIGYTDPIPDRPNPLSLASLATWLTTYAEWWRWQDTGASTFEAIRRGQESLFRLFDRPPARIYAGPCGIAECRHDLYVEAGALQAPCPSCNHVHDVELRREELKQGVRDYLATAKEISALCRLMFGDLVTVKMIDHYAARGHITARGTRTHLTARNARRDVAVYRIGDVLEHVEQISTRPESVRAAKRESKDVA